MTRRCPSLSWLYPALRFISIAAPGLTSPFNSSANQSLDLPHFSFPLQYLTGPISAIPLLSFSSLCITIAFQYVAILCFSSLTSYLCRLQFHGIVLNYFITSQFTSTALLSLSTPWHFFATPRSSLAQPFESVQFLGFALLCLTSPLLLQDFPRDASPLQFQTNQDNASPWLCSDGLRLSSSVISLDMPLLRLSRP